MELNGITREDLQILKVQILDEIKGMLADTRAMLMKLTESGAKEEPQEWVKSGVVRKILKASPGTLQNFRVSGDLNPKKLRGTWYYNLKEVNALFEKGGGHGI